MTIIVGITTPDGVVLASESRTTQSHEGGHRILSDSAQKVFEIGRFGVATTGAAFIAGNTIAGLMDQFQAQLDEADSRDIDAFTAALGTFFDSRFVAWVEEMRDAEAQAKREEEDGEDDEQDGDKQEGEEQEGEEQEGDGEEQDAEEQDAEAGDGDEVDGEVGPWDMERFRGALTFLVAGYDAEGIGHIHEVSIPGPERGDYSPNTTERGTMWRGQTDAITRMLKGVDRARLVLPIDELSDEARHAIDDGFNALEYLHLFPITLQDAIDYASFLIRTTIDMQRFSDGTVGAPGEVPGCGGPLQILVVERGETGWATKPELRVA